MEAVVPPPYSTLPSMNATFQKATVLVNWEAIFCHVLKLDEDNFSYITGKIVVLGKESPWKSNCVNHTTQTGMESRTSGIRE